MKTDPATAGSITKSTAKKMPWIGFGTTILFLVLIAVAADTLTHRLESDDQWVSHSESVERIAAQWLVDGFAQRSKIPVSLEISSKLDRMQQETELVLFRVLQESLTNIHRHSGSKSAEVRVAQHDGTVALTVQDHGLGMPLTILEKFRKSEAGLGVRLAGMRERVHELGGHLGLDSDGGGTRVTVTLPARRRPTASTEAPVPSSGEKQGLAAI